MNHNDKLRLHWNDYSKNYSSLRAHDNLPIISTLGNLVKIRSSKSIIDVGCGPGYGMKYLTHILDHSATIYGVDFSSVMIDICKATFDNYADFTSNKNNTFEILPHTTTDKLTVSEVKNDNNVKAVNVKAIEGDCECLPFANEQFDTYISSLCLQITGNRVKAFNEMYRVLKPNGKFAIAVWGKKELTTCRLIEMTCERFGLKIESFFNFDFGKDPEKVVSELKEIGFRKVRYEYFNQLRYEVETAEEFYDKLYPKDVKLQVEEIMKTDPQKGNEIVQAIKKDLKEFFDSGKTPVMNILMVFGSK